MLHVLVGAACNNNCIFCMESDREGRKKHVDSQTSDDIRRMIDAYPFKDEILFTSGEPTLNPELPGYIGWAHKTGFKTIGLISNARRFSYMDYAARLVRCGLNKVTVSIHGHTARLHESLTRTRGSFQQTVDGLLNLSGLKTRTRLEIHTSTVVVRRNLPHVRDIHDMLTSFGVDRMCFNVMMAKGRGEEKFERLMARYHEISNEFRSLAEAIGPQRVRNVTLADIPRCTVEGLAFELVGDQERFEQFEFLGSTGITHLSTQDLEQMSKTGLQEQDLAEQLRRKLQGEAELSGDADYYLTTRELKDNILRVKRSECRLCRYEERCPGVWEVYVKHHGWSEFEPVGAF